ncbi:MAG: histidine phosphatase family protein [Acidobacteria bacterium]|nr:histidine phosphatase family protein [Acidobacteriota bacterium]
MVRSFRQVVRALGSQAAVALAIAAGVSAAGAQAPAATIVVLVRHAERAALPADDPPISDIGEVRARALAAALADAHVTTVITSSRRRTTDTARPLLEARHLAPEIVGVAEGLDVQVANVAAAVRRQPGGLVLVVGHSNTVPAIVHALGGPRLPDLCDNEYATMFVMELASQPGAASRLIRTHYGTPDPPGAGACAPAPHAQVAPSTAGAGPK